MELILDYNELVGGFSPNLILFDTNNTFNLLPGLLANLTASLSPNFTPLDVLAAINGTLNPVPSPLDCVLPYLIAVSYVLNVERSELTENILEIASSKLEQKPSVDMLMPCTNLTQWFDNEVSGKVESIVSRRNSFIQGKNSA